MFNPRFRVAALITLTAFSSVALTGCAAGGFKLTRGLARWNNSKSIVPRILIYIAFGLLLPVYIITLLVDFVVMNTIDFWEGTVASQNVNYEEKGVHYAVAHVRDPLRHTTIRMSIGDQLKSVVELRELENGKIALSIDGVRRAELNDIRDAGAQLTLYREDGKTPSVTRELSADLLARASVLADRDPAKMLRSLGLPQLETSAPVCLARGD